jgi:hypothetical protein
MILIILLIYIERKIIHTNSIMNLPFLTLLLLLVLMFTRKTLGISNNYTGVIVIIIILLYMSYNVNEFFSTTYMKDE